MNKNMKMYFDHHKGVDTFYFTTDGQAFSTDALARGHGKKLEFKKKGSGAVQAVTRQQVEAWWKDAAPKLLQAAQANVDACANALESAKKAADGLPSGTAPTKKIIAGRIVSEAATALKKAQSELDAAQADADGLQFDMLTVTGDQTDGGSTPLTVTGAADTGAAGGGSTPLTETAPVIDDTDSDEVKAAKQGVIDRIAALNDARTALDKQPKNTGAEKKQAAANKVTAAEAELAVALDALASVTTA